MIYFQNVQQRLQEINFKSAAVKTFKITLGLAAARMLSQLAYNSLLSPNRSNHQPEKSFYSSLYEKRVQSCDDISFKVMQSFFNTFEGSSILPYSFGFNNQNPFGDLRGFALDQNIHGLNCTLQSYPKNAISSQMKNNLLGEVMHAMQFQSKNLSKSMLWLIDHGANPNHQQILPSNRLQKDQENALTPLLIAHRTDNRKLYDALIEKGAKLQNTILAFNPKTKNWDLKTPILSSIVLDIIKNNPALADKPKCIALKDKIDFSIHSLPDDQPYGGKTKEDVTKMIHSLIGNALCSAHFKVDKDDDTLKMDDEFNSFWDKIDLGARAFEKIWKNFKNWYFSKTSSPDDKQGSLSEEDMVNEAFRIIGVRPSVSLRDVKKRCNELYRIYHPDKGGDPNMFMKLRDACQIIKASRKKEG